MTTAPLALLVAIVWLATAGFLRLRTPYDRMHCVSLVTGAGSLLLVLATLAADGLSNRTGKIVLFAAISLLAGAATSHAIGRALRLRGSAPELD